MQYANVCCPRAVKGAGPWPSLPPAVLFNYDFSSFHLAFRSLLWNVFVACVLNNVTCLKAAGGTTKGCPQCAELVRHTHLGTRYTAWVSLVGHTVPRWPSTATDSLLLQVLGSTRGHELCMSARYVNNGKRQGHGGTIKLQGQENRLWLIPSVVTAVSSVNVHPKTMIIYLKYLNSDGVWKWEGKKNQNEVRI